MGEYERESESDQQEVIAYSPTEVPPYYQNGSTCRKRSVHAEGEGL